MYVPRRGSGKGDQSTGIAGVLAGGFSFDSPWPLAIALFLLGFGGAFAAAMFLLSRRAASVVKGGADERRTDEEWQGGAAEATRIVQSAPPNGVSPSMAGGAPPPRTPAPPPDRGARAEKGGRLRGVRRERRSVPAASEEDVQ